MPTETNEQLKSDFTPSARKTREIKDLSAHLDAFLSHYNELDRNQLNLLEQMYTSDVLFIDPFHQIQGLKELTGYFKKLYQNIDSIEFEFGERFVSGNQASVYWEMRFKHPRINSGKQVSFSGNSRLSFEDNGKVSRHQDYFDSAAMLYRHLPVLKQVISFIDGRLS